MSDLVIDVRTIPPRERHPRIFSAFDALAPGQAIELRNDHEPRPLMYQFAHERPDLFTWDPIEEGPDVWRIRIIRNA
jgi:uncharacterized protein (DUF2249 family)